MRRFLDPVGEPRSALFQEPQYFPLPLVLFARTISVDQTFGNSCSYFHIAKSVPQNRVLRYAEVPQSLVDDGS